MLRLLKVMQRKAQKALTHARVLLAAKECFANRDVREVSMAEVAERAESSVGALYMHFRSRSLLMDAVVTELQGQLIGSLKAVLASTEERSVAKAIERLAEAYVSAVGELRPYLSLHADHVARAMSIDVLRTGGGAAPIEQMLRATLGTLTVLVPMRVDVAMLASSVIAVWRNAGIAYTPRPPEDAAVVAASLAALTVAIFQGVAPELLEFDARQLARAMAHHLKGQIVMPADLAG